MDKAGAGAAHYRVRSAPNVPSLATAAGAPVGLHSIKWSSGLCDCSDDMSCITCFCPCITFGKVAEIVDRGNTSCGTDGALYGLLCSMTGLHWIYSCVYRSKLRKQYGLPNKPCCDCLLHCCCGYCALCQEYRELKSRGYDMKLANAKQITVIALKCSVYCRMARQHGKVCKADCATNCPRNDEVMAA